MTMLSWGSPGRGFQRLEALAAEGYEIADVQSDDELVCVAMRRPGACVTVLLTRDDFALLFPRYVPAGDERARKR